MSNYLLEVKNISKKIGKRQIIDNLSFNIKRGEIVGFLGPNGSGKTTTIKMILGLLSLDSGTVTIDGHDVKQNFEAALSKVGSIIENPDMYTYMSGRDNINFYARMHKKVSKERIDQIMKFVKLSERAGDKIKKYSLGMKQRLGLAQALIHNPELIILDEPTNGLDPMGIKELRETLVDLSHNESKSVFVSSHLLSEMELLCDRVIIIDKGVLIGEEVVSDNGLASSNNMHDQFLYQFYVSDTEKAEDVIKSIDSGFEIDSIIKGKSLSIKLSRVEVSKVNKALVLKDVDVYEIVKCNTKLEQQFINITNSAENRN